MRGFGGNARSLRQKASMEKVRLFFHCCKDVARSVLLLRRRQSTGREYFSYNGFRASSYGFPGADARDVQATLAELTAVSIAQQVLLNGGCERLMMVCGGGSRNPLVMKRRGGAVAR